MDRKKLAEHLTSLIGESVGKMGSIRTILEAGSPQQKDYFRGASREEFKLHLQLFAVNTAMCEFAHNVCKSCEIIIAENSLEKEMNEENPNAIEVMNNIIETAHRLTESSLDIAKQMAQELGVDISKETAENDTVDKCSE